MVKDIAFTAYPCANVATARAWYELHLGLTFSGAFEEGGVEMYNEANVGSGCFALIAAAWVERPAGSGVGVTFEVDDLDAMVKSLREHNVVMDDIYDMPTCKVSSCNDAEGNRLTLHQRK